MNSLATRLAPTARRLVTAAAVAAGLGTVMPAQAQYFDGLLKPGSVYVAGSLGLLIASYECDGTATCEPPRIGGKLFGGYRFTPDLAAEVGFFYMGKFSSAGAAGASNLRNSAVTVGFDWSNEMFGIARQHIRFGVARVNTSGTESLGPSGAPQTVNEHDLNPYLGLGLSYQLNPYIRLYSSYDTMRNKRNKNFHLLSVGVGIEN